MNATANNAESAKRAVTELLASLSDPRNGQEMVASGLLSSLQIRPVEGGQSVSLILEPGEEPLPKGFSTQLQDRLSAIPGVVRATVVVTSHRESGRSDIRMHESSEAKEKDRRIAAGHANPLGVAGASKVADGKIILPGVKAVLAVASGKGGVGKSTIAANLAVALAQKGFKIGLMDADIYGPSLPTLLGIHGRPEFENGKLQPIEKFGIKSMSIGLLVEEEQALAWRGPMVMGAVRQLLTEVNWGSLDLLIIDTPPGTGDAHLTLIQKLTLSGALIVTTPQEMALADVRRGAALFTKMKTPILGLVENMAWLEMPDGSRQQIFAQGGAMKAAQALGLEMLAQLPLYPQIGIASDGGVPIAAIEKEDAASKAFSTLAGLVAQKLSL